MRGDEMLYTKAAYKYLADIIMPNSCAFCGRVIAWDRLLCDSCGGELPESFDGVIPIENTEGAVGIFYFEDKIAELIYKLKQGGDVYNFAELCAARIAERLRGQGLAEDIDLVTAVPMHRSKRLARGQDQAELLARFTADALGKPADFKLLRRDKDKTEQHKLEKDERQAHAERVYSSRESHRDIKGLTLLICDDVMTTGSTIRACGAHLKKMGAEKVYAASAAVSTVYRKSEKALEKIE